VGFLLALREIFLHQICYGDAPLDPGFRILDNSSNERPDWFEYWPIRQFLLIESLDEESFYGFFSPRFRDKTNLTARGAHDFVNIHGNAADVVLLSPSIHLTAYHLNVFKYGDTCHPGFLNVASRFFRRIGHPTNLNILVTDSRNEVYSNYIVARPRFWRAWLHITEQLFAIAEMPNDPLGIELRNTTCYRGGRDVQMKIFLMERVATWILSRDSTFVIRARDPFVARSRIYKLPGAILCDALKLAYRHNGRRKEFVDLFHLVSKFGKLLSWQMRLGSLLGIRRITSCTRALSSYWAEES